MQITRIPNFRLAPPALLTFEEEEAERQQEEMREAVKNEELVTDPPVVDVSAAVQMGYLHNEDHNLEIGGGLGIHYRPFFHLELNYNLSIQGLDALDDAEQDMSLGLRQDLGVTIINTLSAEGRTNVGIRLALTYIRNLMGPETENLLGITTGFEFANYTPRFFLEYTWLSDLNGGEIHQAAMGLRVPFNL